jgi:uncharacterized protein
MLASLVLLAEPAYFARAAPPSFPALTGRIVDEARLLGAGDRAEIETMLRELEAKSTDQIVIVTLTSLQGLEIEDYGYQLGRHWRIGQQGVNNGVLLIVAPNERKVRIEVGRGLEPQMTDLMSKLIIDNALLPAFRRGDLVGGIKAATRDIRDVLLGDAEAVKQRARSGKKRSGEAIDWPALIFFTIWLAMVLLIVRAQYRAARQVPKTGAGYRGDSRHRRTSGSGPDVIVIPGGWGGSGSWSGSGSGGSGGGFSGGGGDFGGGGASGSW